MKRFIVALCVIGLVCACGSPNVAKSSPSAQPAATQSATPAATAAPSASPAAGPSPSVPAGFVLADASGGAVTDSTVTDVRIAQHDGYDRFVIEFGGGVPSYSVTRQSEATFTRSPKGDQVTIEGTAGVLVVVHSVSNWTTYSAPTAFHPGYPCVRQALQVENFEGYQQWALGVQGTPALRVFTLESPSRLVVDVAVV